MTTLTTPLGYLIMGTVLFSVGCATTAPPSELVFARAAYLHVHTGQAQQLVPDEVRIAERALASAEQSFKDAPRSFITRDLAYYAGQKAHHAEMLAIAAVGVGARVPPPETGRAEKITLVRMDQAPTPLTHAEVPTLAPLLEEAYGVVATFPTSVLFAPERSDLLPAACDRLNKIAAVLMVTNERRLTVEGHSDSQGSAVFNRVLSQQRANVVRAYIISRGYAGNLILASGLGDASPVASNASPEGRATNRRINIIMDASLQR